MRFKRLLTGSVILIVIAASFVILNFGLSQNDSRLESYPTPEFLLGTPQIKPSLLIYVEDGIASNELRESLVKDFSEIFKDVNVTHTLLDKFDTQVLIVEYSKSSLLYTPFYSKAHVELNMTFSSNGDISWRIYYWSKGIGSDQPRNTAWYMVTMVLDDQSYGIMSLKHYTNYLAQRFADNMKSKIEKMLDYLHISFKSQSETVESFTINVLLRWEIVRRDEF